MRLRRSANGDTLPGTGFDAFACGLLAMTRIIVGWTKVRQAVIVAWRHVVDGVGARQAAEVAEVPVEGVDGGLGAPGGLPVGREPSTAIGVLPAATGHDEDLLNVIVEMYGALDQRARVRLALLDGGSLITALDAAVLERLRRE